MHDIKKKVQAEILALLDETIDREIDQNNGHLTVAELAKEILLQSTEVAQ